MSSTASDGSRKDRCPGDAAVSGDGSPVPVFLALPCGEAPRLIHRAVGPGASLLERGCGAGRITRPLVAMGHPVVAVDDSAAMLAHVTGAETVHADIFTLALKRTFGAVVAGSYFVNSPDPDRRRALYEVCRRHVRPEGVVLVQRHDPEWLADPVDSSGEAGPVDVDVRILGQRSGEVEIRVSYAVGERSWAIEFVAAHMPDSSVAAEAAACGLRLDGVVDDAGSWLRLVPA
jgi:SAM-dependent methyltransferase